MRPIKTEVWLASKDALSPVGISWKITGAAPWGEQECSTPVLLVIDKEVTTQTFWHGEACPMFTGFADNLDASMAADRNTWCCMCGDDYPQAREAMNGQKVHEPVG